MKSACHAVGQFICLLLCGWSAYWPATADLGRIGRHRTLAHSVASWKNIQLDKYLIPYHRSPKTSLLELIGWVGGEGCGRHVMEAALEELAQLRNTKYQLQLLVRTYIETEGSDALMHHTTCPGSGADLYYQMYTKHRYELHLATPGTLVDPCLLSACISCLCTPSYIITQINHGEPGQDSTAVY
jgi:hypothetical protein